MIVMQYHFLVNLSEFSFYLRGIYFCSVVSWREMNVSVKSEDL